MEVELVTVGTELLLGFTVDTNSAEIGRALAAAGVREVNLVAQDSTSWGKDLPAAPGRGRPKLHDLVRALDEVEALIC